MKQSMKFDVNHLPELYTPDMKRIEAAKTRQAAVWKGERPDQWPILMRAPLTKAQQEIPDPNLKEAFYDADLMLCSQVRSACTSAYSRSDAVPSVRVNFGTGTTLSCLGLEQEVYPDKMPWLKQHLTKAQISKLAPDDIKVQGTFKRGLDFMRRYKEIMGDSLPIFCMDTQGPFDLAHLMMGDDFFYELHDDPPFVHHLMNLCVELGTKTHEWMKEVSTEPRNMIYHSNTIYAENMGIRICEDTTAIVGPEAINEFAMPYTQRLAQHFGGAWVHYCGRNDNLTDAVCQIPEIRGINFGHIPGHEHDHQFEEDMQRCFDSKKVYFGWWPRLEGESGAEYLVRLYKWSNQGRLIPEANIAVGEDKGFADITEVMDYWYSL